jgi:hypothetical protein
MTESNVGMEGAMNKLTFTAAAIVLALTVTPTLAQQGNQSSPSNNPQSSPSNNPYASQNNPQNQPTNNPDHSQLGGRNAIHDTNDNYTGYAVPKADGSAINIFHTDGE